MSHTIELREVSKYYSEQDTVSMGISRVNLELDMGEFVVITGESGSGKSTLLNVISGLDTYEEGEMFVCGEDTAAYGTKDYEAYRKKYIGNIFQEFNLINSYTVYQNIELVMLISGKEKGECKSRVDELIELVGLSQYSNTKASKLSGGQKQRVAIARALAKNAPIIVADEPTGNLDSESAEAVMQTLARVSKDKLVIIVTHNYEQVERYASRKLTMYDGKIIEDKKIHSTDNAERSFHDKLYDELEAEARFRNGTGEDVPAENNGINKKHGSVSCGMRKASEIMLGVRNTFNLPAKFILLFVVYLFVSTSVLGQYATTKDSMHEKDMLGTNPYFANTSSSRIVIKKADESNFTDSDFAAVLSTPNIKEIIKNDLAIDKGVSIRFGNSIVECAAASFDQINQGEITFGHMPRSEHEIVIRVDASSDVYVDFATNGDEYIGLNVELLNINQQQRYMIKDNITVAGIIIDNGLDNEADYSMYGYSTIYMSDSLSEELLAEMMAEVSEAELSFENVHINNDYQRVVFSSPNVPEGMVYLLEDQLYYYKDEKAEGKDLGLKISNMYFESEGKYKVDKIITSDNCKQLLDIPAGDYDSYYSCIFISPEDFSKLFDKGFYQISAFMINEQDSDATRQALNENGYTMMPIKESLTDSTGNLRGLLNLLTYARLALEFIILFTIAYIVIRLIMRSRNPYYSTLRMLGASKGNTSNILRVELILMMLIAYGVDVLFAVLINKGVIQELTGQKMNEITKILYYLTPLDYTILGMVLLMMSLLIANRYSRHIFSKSAMKTFREGA